MHFKLYFLKLVQKKYTAYAKRKKSLADCDILFIN